jgi:outer membrane protein OmpA-like peptidoglycan-associated protein
VVDNVSGEDWKDVTVGVGSTSALSFRYDLHSVRVVERETLGDERAFAAAGPMGGSPYAVAEQELQVMAALDDAMLGALMGDDPVDGLLSDERVPAAAPASTSASSARPRRADGKRTRGEGREALAAEVAEAEGIGAGAYASGNKAKSKAEAEGALTRLAAQLQQAPGKVALQGFARSGDADPRNAALSRARQVRDELVKRGVPTDKLDVGYSGQVDDSQAIRIVAQGGDSRPQQGRAQGEGAAQAQGSAYFVSKVPMTIEKDRSAMVSLLKDKTKAERVYYYDAVSPRGSRDYAFQAVRFDNPSDQTLDRGPFTVYSQGQFLGEGLSDAIPPHSHAFVPYALDRQIAVEPKLASWEEVHGLLALERGVAHAELHQVVKTTLVVRNRSDEAARVYVRHALPGGFSLRNQGKDVERLGSDFLFPLDVPARGTRELSIEQFHPTEHAIDLRTAQGAEQVATWLERATKVAPELSEQLKSVIALHREMAALSERHVTLDEQAGQYRQRMSELTEQLASLRKVRNAGDLAVHLGRKLREVNESAQQTAMKTTDVQENLMTARIRLQDQLADLRMVRAGAPTAVAAR